MHLQYQACQMSLATYQMAAKDLLAGCNITLYYNTGFCYLMMRRYLDAARAFNIGLAYINRYALRQHGKAQSLLASTLHSMTACSVDTES